MPENAFRISHVQPHETDAFLSLADEMDRFYGLDELDHVERTARTQQALFENPPKAYAIAAWQGERAVGLATYSFMWPAEDLTTSLYLKELYVAQYERQKGIGRALVGAVCTVAQSQQCTRVELSTERTNFTARQFYARLGLPENTMQTVRYRLGIDDIDRVSNCGQIT